MTSATTPTCVPLGARAITLALAVFAAGCSEKASVTTPTGTQTGDCEGAACPTADPCAGTANCTAFVAGRDDENRIQEAIIAASPGQVFAFSAGEFRFTNTLSVAVDDVTLRGADKTKTVLDFSGQTTGSEGIFATSDGFTVADLEVRETVGDAIKVKGAERATFRRVKVSWSREPAESHGAYGLYPVQCRGVLIEDSEAYGASDAGIYVGQSERIVVRRNRASSNVAGIEIENSVDADVMDNVTEGNTAGILIFSLPELEKKQGGRVRVLQNVMRNNNGRNFAQPGGVIEVLPSGTGLIVMANNDVEVFANVIGGNDTMNVAITSYLMTQRPYTDPKYYPFPERVHVHDNTFSAGGASPDKSKDLGQLLEAGRASFKDGRVPDVLYDGLVDETKTYAPGNPMAVCLGTGERGSFAKLEDVSTSRWSTSTDAFACSLEPLPAIDLGF